MPEGLSEHARETTLHVTRTMFPHDGLPDEAYEKVVRALEADADAVAMIESGVTALDDPRAFLELDADGRLEALERNEGSELFTAVHAMAVVELYDNPLVWEAFGYEGPSVHLGGYVNRGFDDLDWLPDPPILIDWEDAPSHATPETTAKFNKG